MSYATAYSLLFDNFVQERNLDLDDRYWPQEIRMEWAEIFSKFQISWEREQLFPQSSESE